MPNGGLQIGYSAKMGDDETEAKVANRLLWRRYRATRSGSDFNRPLTYKSYALLRALVTAV